MNARKTRNTAFLAFLLASSAASAGEYARPNQFEQASAIAACLAFNDDATFLKAVKDGVGDHLVWLRLASGETAACNSSASGHVFANFIVGADLLGGTGPSILQQVSSSDHPAEIAAALCAARQPGAEIDTTAPDGRGDYLVWLETADTIFLCNASADGELWFLGEVGDALEKGTISNTPPATLKPTSLAMPTALDGSFQVHPTPISPTAGATPAA